MDKAVAGTVRVRNLLGATANEARAGHRGYGILKEFRVRPRLPLFDKMSHSKGGGDVQKN
ncbi:MAG TPA: hypothetical protein VLZ10_02290 [Thermodesulfobacteriota bacterium]|nr:hypothetical protein [Thermodesulfobacteriota bacterium]